MTAPHLEAARPTTPGTGLGTPATDVEANTVAAGPLDTPAFRTMFGDLAQTRLDAAAAANPSGRGLTVADVVGAVAWVASPAASMV